MAKAHSFIRMVETPIEAAASSSSLMAAQARPILDLLSRINRKIQVTMIPSSSQ